MNLDKRIKALTDIQSVTNGCYDWEFMTKKGYFADRLVNFQDLSKCEYGEYVDYREHDKCFHCEVILPDGTTDYNWFTYFIPEDTLLPKEPEKKYRPFDIKEFIKKYHVGSVFQIRQKREEITETCVQYVGYKVHEQRIYLGITDFTLDELFEDFELLYDGKWQPFGVIVEEDE